MDRAKKSASPPVVLTPLAVEGHKIFVVRDDLLEGGTKQRAALPFLSELHAEGAREFVYAGPFCGFAQVAIAASCRELGYACTLFSERDPSAPSPQSAEHPLTQRARSMGANIVLCNGLPEAEGLSESYCLQASGRFKIPLGFNHPAFKRHMVAELKKEWALLAHALERPPETLWLPLGSGTLLEVFHSFLPPEIRLAAVNVHVLGHSDPRIQRVRALPGVTYYEASMPFHQEASETPPVPSNIFYDAKLWAFIRQHGRQGDVWWNVAK